MEGDLRWGEGEETVVAEIREGEREGEGEGEEREGKFDVPKYPVASYPGLTVQLFSQPWKNTLCVFPRLQKKSCEGRPGYEAKYPGRVYSQSSPYM